MLSLAADDTYLTHTLRPMWATGPTSTICGWTAGTGPPLYFYLQEIDQTILASHPLIRFVILATDGLWDYLPEQEAVDIVASCLPEGRQKEAAERLVRRALELAAEVGFYLETLILLHSYSVFQFRKAEWVSKIYRHCRRGDIAETDMMTPPLSSFTSK